MTGISAIGYNPLGNVGLGSTGTYATYDYCMPSSMGMMCGMPGMMGVPGMGYMPSMMGMYNYMTPENITNMNQRIETSHLNHTADMHQRIKTMEVNNNLQSADALIARQLNDGGIQRSLAKLKEKIDAGDLEGAVNIHKELKGLVYDRFKDEIANRGSEIKDVAEYVSTIIDTYYNDLHKSTILEDLDKSGENPFMNGYKQICKKGHSKLTIQEAKSAMYGMRIDGASHEKFLSWAGKGAGTISSFIFGGAGGAAAGAGLFILANITASFLSRGKFKMDWSNIGDWSRVGAGLGAVGNTVWKFI